MKYNGKLATTPHKFSVFNLRHNIQILFYQKCRVQKNFVKHGLFWDAVISVEIEISDATNNQYACSNEQLSSFTIYIVSLHKDFVLEFASKFLKNFVFYFPKNILPLFLGIFAVRYWVHRQGIDNSLQNTSIEQVFISPTAKLPSV